MTVGYTKFAPDRVFGQIRNRTKRSEALSLPEFMENTVSDANNCSTGKIFDHCNHVRDCKSGVAKIFQKLQGFRSRFYYSITIDAVVEENGKRNVIVTTSCSPNGTTTEVFKLWKKEMLFPDLEDDKFFPKLAAKVIEKVRRESL